MVVFAPSNFINHDALYNPMSEKELYIKNLKEIADNLPSDSAFGSDAALLVHLSNYQGEVSDQVRAIVGGLTLMVILSKEPISTAGYVQPPYLGKLASHYSSILSQSCNISLKHGDDKVSLPVIPAEYLLAQYLTSTSARDRIKAASLVKYGKEKLDDEKLRGILKSIGAESDFDDYLQMKYFL